MAKEILNEFAAADYIGMSVSFLRCGRSKGRVGNHTAAPPYLKLGFSVRYERTALDEWLAALRRRSTADDPVPTAATPAPKKPPPAKRRRLAAAPPPAKARRTATAP
jgi:hypothetical protein